MQRKDGTFCPYIQDDCLEFKCKLFQKIIGVNPQTGDKVDEYDCAILWNNLLLIETSQQTRQAGSAIESFRNEMVGQNNILLAKTNHELLT